jgi:tetratricopeptide (TPR) repeat protein
MNWLAGKAVYYRKFHDKWIANKMPNAIYLDYTELAANAKSCLKAIVERTTGAADEARLDAVIEKTRAPRSNAAFKPRVAEDSPYFDAELLAPFEAWILEHCPRYNFPSQLGGSFADSELYGLILLRDATQPLPGGETKRFKAAAALAPDHPEVQRRLAGRALKEGRVDQAMHRLEKLIAAYPYFPDAYAMLFKACANSDTEIPESVLTGNALVACSESAELSMELGAAFGEKGLWLNAIAAYALAVAVEPKNTEASERHAAALKQAR